MKNIFKKLGSLATVLIVLITFGTTTTVLAAETDPPASTGQTLSKTVDAPTPKELLPHWHDENQSSKVNIVYTIDQQTQGSWGDILANIIKFALAITGALALVAFTYAGILMITARGTEEQIKKGKEMIFMSILGLAIIAISYAIVLGISNLKFS